MKGKTIAIVAGVAIVGYLAYAYFYAFTWPFTPSTTS